MSRIFLTCSIACLGALTSGAAFADNDEFDHPEKKKFDFALIGDTGYSPNEFQAVFGLIDEISRAKVEFALHLGDIKGQALPTDVRPCTDEVFTAIHDQLDALAHPLIYTPGDNEWTDCPFAGPPGVIAEERLGALRRIFFPGVGSDPLYSLGQRRMLLNSQSADPAHATFRENTRWQFGEIMFVMVNVPESDNQGVTRCLQFNPSNVCVRTGIDDTEWETRTAANVAWLNLAFDLAIQQEMKGIVVGTQANFIGRFYPSRFDPASPRYKAVLAAIKAGARRFGGQVLFVHGDTHTPRIDQPYNGNMFPEVALGSTGNFLSSDQVIENLTRVEVYGSTAPTRAGASPQKWFRVSVDPRSRRVFTIVPGYPESRDRE